MRGHTAVNSVTSREVAIHFWGHTHTQTGRVNAYEGLRLKADHDQQTLALTGLVRGGRVKSGPNTSYSSSIAPRLRLSPMCGTRALSLLHSEVVRVRRWSPRAPCCRSCALSRENERLVYSDKRFFSLTTLNHCNSLQLHVTTAKKHRSRPYQYTSTPPPATDRLRRKIENVTPTTAAIIPSQTS